MKQAIIIIGNMASGKSTLARLLADRLDYWHVCLDHFREKCSTAFHLTPIQRETLAQTQCLAALKQPGDVIFESTGVSSFYRKALDMLDREGVNLQLIRIDCPEKICIERYYARKNNALARPPVRGHKAMTPEETIHLIEKKLREMPFSFCFQSHILPPQKMVEIFLQYQQSGISG